QVKNRALALVEDPEAGREDRAVLGHLVLVLLRAERLERIEVALVVHARPRGQRQRAVGAATLQRLEDLLLRDLGGLRKLGDRGGAPQLDGLLLEQPRELDVQLLQAARHADGPAAVAEVALDLADDVRRGVGGQLDAAVDVEPVDRLDEPDRADLDEIFELLTAVRVAPGQRAHERHVLLDQLLAGCEITLLVIPPEKDLVALLRHGAVSDRRTRFSSSIHSPSSRSTAVNPSTTVSSTRRKPTPSSSRSSSARRAPERNGPSVAATVSSRTTSSTISSPSAARRSSSVASAVPRSYMTS